MGKYMKKCKGIGDIAVMEVAPVGVRTRARTLAMETASAGRTKRRKVVSGEIQFSPSCVALRSRRHPVIMPDEQISPATSENTSHVICSSSSSDHFPSSRCSSNGSSELVKGSLRSVDLEGEGFETENSTYSNCRERRETTPSSDLRSESGDLESTGRREAENSRLTLNAEKMPSAAEIEEFFSAAEKAEKKRFADKYNYDIVKDVPLKGRYEWVQLKP